MNPPFKFSFLHSEYSTVPVAMHPHPVGVVQFIGDTFFGTYPTLFYRFLIKKLFEQGYTVIAFPFRFSFDHWSVALQLLQEQTGLRKALITAARSQDYDYEIYTQDPKLAQGNYCWVGHGIGCNYLALLEVLSDAASRTLPGVLHTCLDPEQRQQVETLLADMDLAQISIQNQPLVLIAPIISETESAIPLPTLATFLNRQRAGVVPTAKQTRCLIRQSRRFNLMGLISYPGDRVAAPTVKWLLRNLSPQLPLSRLPGGHLSALGLGSGDPRLAIALTRMLQFLRQDLDSPVTLGTSGGT